MEWFVSQLGEEVVARYCERHDTAPLGRAVYGTPKWPKTVSKAGRDIPVPTEFRNTVAMLKHHGITVRHNLMTHGPEIVTPDGVVVVAERAENAGVAFIRDLARKYNLQIAAVEDHLQMLLGSGAYHPVAQWLTSQQWDGRDRLEELLSSLTLAKDFAPDLSLVLLRTWLVTAVKAATVPAGARQGVAAQGVLVLQGPQDANKTRWFESLCPQESNWFKDGLILDPTSRDSVQTATRYWLAELGELDATFRKADIARLKSFITEKADTYRSAYDRREEQHARRTVFCGSVNPSPYLVDNTGNRRFWTVPVTVCNPDPSRLA